MEGWGDVGAALDGLVDFASVRSTKLTAGNSVLATLRGTEGEGANEEAADCEVWGVAGVQSRPKASNAQGAAEVIMLRQHDELLAFATRDLRYQVSVVEGELAIHALGKDGATQAVVRCKPDGTVVVDGVQVLLGGAASAENSVRGTTFIATLDVFAQALAAATTVANVAAAGTALHAALTGGGIVTSVVKLP